MTVSQRIIIRDATLDDADTLAAILRESFEEYRGVLSPPSTALEESTVKMRKRLEKTAGLLASVGNEAAGCVFFESERDFVYLYRLGVRPAFRRMGIARQLIARVEQHARQMGYATLRLATRIALEPNHAYYRRLGYRFLKYGEKLYEDRPFYVVMEKDLRKS